MPKHTTKDNASITSSQFWLEKGLAFIADRYLKKFTRPENRLCFFNVLNLHTNHGAAKYIKNFCGMDDLVKLFD